MKEKLWLLNQGKHFILKYSLFGAIKLMLNDNPDKYFCSGLAFDTRGSF